MTALEPLPAGVKGGPDGTLTAFRCDCGHLLRQEASEVDGRVLWFHHGETLVDGMRAACPCRLVPGCGGGWLALGVRGA